jgi:hypothetical protein
MDTPKNAKPTGELLRLDPPPTCSPLADLLEAFKALGRLNDAAKVMDEKAWALIEALTNDPREYPKAVKIGTIETDVATIRIDGVTSEPMEIMTGADGGFDVYADSYDDCGLPGRIIIELHREILPENV